MSTKVWIPTQQQRLLIAVRLERSTGRSHHGELVDLLQHRTKPFSDQPLLGSKELRWVVVDRRDPMLGQEPHQTGFDLRHHIHGLALGGREDLNPPHLKQTCPVVVIDGRDGRRIALDPDVYAYMEDWVNRYVLVNHSTPLYSSR